ncbi:hypothetical protein F511_38279 [Dorcoceras hygrometricum]|uniref:Uncharacterized protein n=1 Tax=Dorcoceras hygrometricum TaxID=472368 RepID=A0A2Z7B062_9LAMI|nr:hypothetical protein F511_38279 [Dorcoceras hygrometricum]
MSLFDLQDVCIAIGSLATLDLPMVVDLIGIYVLKGPYFYLAASLLSHTPPIGRRLAPPRAVGVCRRLRGQTCFDHRDEELPSMPNSSSLLVQAEEGVFFAIVDLIDDLPQPTV